MLRAVLLFHIRAMATAAQQRLSAPGGYRFQMAKASMQCAKQAASVGGLTIPNMSAQTAPLLLYAPKMAATGGGWKTERDQVTSF